VSSAVIALLTLTYAIDCETFRAPACVSRTGRFVHGTRQAGRPVASPGFVVKGHDDRGAEGAIIETPSGVGYGKGCPLPSRLGGLGSVVSSPSEVRGRAPAAIAFSAYFRPQNASGSKKNTACMKLKTGHVPQCPMPGNATVGGSVGLRPDWA